MLDPESLDTVEQREAGSLERDDRGRVAQHVDQWSGEVELVIAPAKLRARLGPTLCPPHFLEAVEGLPISGMLLFNGLSGPEHDDDRRKQEDEKQ